MKLYHCGDRGRRRRHRRSIPQAKRVLERVAQKHDVSLRVSGFRLGRGALFPLGQHDARRRDRSAAALRRDSAGRRRPSRDSRSHHAERPAAAHPARVRSIRQRAPGVPLSRACRRRSPKQAGGEIDFVVVRENTEGEYAQVGGFVYQHQPEEVAIQTSVFTRRGIDRIVRFAFELARQAQQEEARHLDHQIQRAGLQHGAVGPRVPGGGRGVSRHRDRIAAGGCGGDELHPPAGELRCGGGLESVRRHPERHLGDHHRQHGPGGQRQSGSAAPRSLRCSSRCTARRRISPARAW